jgi:virulence factor Mce-like protein
MSLFKAGIVGSILIILISYAAYTKFANPFASKFTVHALVPSAAGLRPDSLVRIAGINVGKVDSVDPVNGSQEAKVTMEIDDMGLPIHSDATFSIRPRIFLEGNFFVDLHPGSPSAPAVSDGFTFPIQSGSQPVQLDQVLTSLPQDTRSNLQTLLQQYGHAINTSGPAFNKSIDYWLPAYEYSSIVAHDALGIQPHDLSNWINQGGTVAAAIDMHPQNLKSLITDFNTTAGAFARQNVALRQAVANLPVTLHQAIPAFNALNNAFPPLRSLARTLTPGVVSTGPMIDASLPFISQLRQLVQPSELQGLTSDLSVTVPALARLTNATIPFMTQGVRPASSCVANVIHPWSQLTINDPNFNSGNGFPPRKTYVEGVDYLPGLAGESRVFDANGPVIRVGMTAGTLTYSLAPQAFGQALAPLGGVQPEASPGKKRPPLMENVPCETQPAITDLSTPTMTLSPVAGSNGGVLGNLLGGITHLLPLAKDTGSSSATSSTSTAGSAATTGATAKTGASTTSTSTSTTAHP